MSIIFNVKNFIKIKTFDKFNIVNILNVIDNIKYNNDFYNYKNERNNRS